jgi:glycosyltransferase involved in cell wall biosynthesis
MNQEQLFPEREAGRPAATVSVLIRTTGRASLAAAVASVRAQVFKDWQVLVLNASGTPNPQISKCMDGVPGRVIEPGARADRAHAANLLLDAADTEFALFLDDDDWLLPGHLGKLAAALREEPQLVAAYGDVVAIAGAGTAHERVVHTFESEFDPVALQMRNSLPIHSVLFRMDAVRAAHARFDEGMSLFEDWDFWLQLVRQGPFRRVPGVSAVYAFEQEQGSGHAAQGTKRDAMLAAFAQRQLARWQPGDVVDLIARAGERDNSINELAQRVAATEHEVAATAELLAAARQEAQALVEARDAAQAWAADLSRELSAQEAEVARQHGELAQQQHQIALQQRELALLAQVREGLLAQIAEIHASRSWRLTSPLRYAGRVARGIRRRLRTAGGIARTVGDQLKRHGAVGLARRMPYYLRHRDAYLSKIANPPPSAAHNPFAAPPAPVRDGRLHPDLEGGIAPIAATVSVVIPTYNAGPEFAWLLRKLNGQKAVQGVEVVIVDSGSSDGTVQAAKDAGATLVQIPQSEFSHSHARNLGAQHASGEYLLFMVQDAFPIGDHWMAGMLRALRDPAAGNLAAVSCSEFARSDSDLMYDAMIDTHYRFLGCLEQDRVGMLRGTDHMALRSQGQLSDVSCLIPRELFGQYRYRGDYAEDLDLGIRLIKDGWKVAMLASVKVVHSHNRPAWYYLKRSFVDVVFLVGMFDDFTFPACESLPGLALGIASAGGYVSQWLAQIEGAPADHVTGAQLKEWLLRWNRELQQVRVDSARAAAEPFALGDSRLDAYVAKLPQRFPVQKKEDSVALAEARRFADSFFARLQHVANFAATVYDDGDAIPAAELAGVVAKTYAAAAGSALAFHALGVKEGGAYPEGSPAAAVHAELSAGV